MRGWVSKQMKWMPGDPVTGIPVVTKSGRWLAASSVLGGAPWLGYGITNTGWSLWLAELGDSVWLPGLWSKYGEWGAGLWAIMGYGYGSDTVTSSNGVLVSLIALSLSMAASSGHLQKASHRPPFRLHQLSTLLYSIALLLFYCPATLLLCCSILCTWFHPLQSPCLTRSPTTPLPLSPAMAVATTKLLSQMHRVRFHHCLITHTEY